jgi:hypothetical protein
MLISWLMWNQSTKGGSTNQKLIFSIYHSQTSSSISLFWGEKEAIKKKKIFFVLQRQEEHKFVYGPIH